MDENKKNVQLLWGLALVFMGVALLFRIPQIIPTIEQIEKFRGIIPFIQFCFYFMAVVLIGGGIKKILQFKKRDDI